MSPDLSLPPNGPEDGDSHKEDDDGQDYPTDPTGSTGVNTDGNGLHANSICKSSFASLGPSSEDELSQSGGRGHPSDLLGLGDHRS